MSRDLVVLGISGSLRRGSYNSAALRAARQLAPAGMRIDIADIGSFPLYNDDARVEHGYPAAVAEFRRQLAEADAVLFVTPEYNYSVPGVLKNAIDWGSRPPDQPFNGKPVAIMGAATGMIGSARAQYHLRQTMVFLNAFALNKPEVMIASAASKFDEQGNLTDEATRGFIKQLLESLADWTRRLSAKA